MHKAGSDLELCLGHGQNRYNFKLPQYKISKIKRGLRYRKVVLSRVVKKTVFFISCFFREKNMFFFVFLSFFFPCIRFLHF